MRKKKRVLAAVLAAVLIICTVFAEADVTVAATSIDTSTSTDAVVQETDAMVQESEEQIVDETETDATVPETEDQIADETVDDVQETIKSESETETQEIISEETEEETEEKTQEVIASYPWSDLDDEAFCAWVTGGEHDEELKAMEEEHGQEYETFQQRLEEITAQDVLQRIMQYITNLNGLNESIVTMNIDTDAFNSMCQSIFGMSYADFHSNSAYAEVYVGENAGGEQTGDLGTQTKPYNTVNAAYSSLSSKSGVIIHLLESYGSVAEPITTWPDNPIPAIIVSDAYETAVLNMSGLKWNLPANTGFYNVKINLAYANNTTATIFANGHHVVFGGKEENNFAFINTDANRYYPTLFGASEQGTGTQSSHSSVANTYLEVYGGTWSQIFGGGEYYSDVDGTATVIVNGSYMEDGTLKPGAVTFADTGLSYMEGSCHIYGGGAGVYTLLSKENYSNVANTDVTISYITTSKYLTPCGGSVTASAKISLDHVNAMGVNARSEGSSASKVSIVIQNSTISEYVGALGDNIGGTKQTYKLVSDINDFDITIRNSTVGALYVKSGALADAEYNNYVTGVDLCLEDSTFTNGITLARLPANYEHGVVNLLRLKNVKCNRYHAEANFGEIKKIELIGIGTEAKPFKWENYTFGSTNYGNVNSVSESLLIENSYVNFGIDYFTQSLALKGNSRIRLRKNLSMETGDFAGDTASQITLEDGSTVNISGIVTETGITVDPEFTTENASAQILWSRGSNESNLSYVSSDKEGYQFTQDHTARMDIWKWYNYDPPVSEYSYVYVDGGLGYDTAEEYNSDLCTDANLGYNKLYPVKTLAKAYSLCKNSNYVIVLCGEYDLTVGETPVSLLGDAEAKDFPVRVQSTDDRNDYRSVAKLRFAGSTGNVTLSAPLIFDNMKLESSVAGGSVRIFSNGNKTEYGAGVNVIRVGDKCSVEVYGGADGANVASADLTVKAAYFDKIGAVGKDDTASVGNKDKIVQTDIVRLTVSENSEGASSVCYYGTTYGSVHTELSYAVGSKNIYNANSSNGTVHGDFYTEVSSGNNNMKYASVVPGGLTVNGKVSFVDQSGKTRYFTLNLNEGKFNEVDIDLSVESIGSVSLFNSRTKASHIGWNISGSVPKIFGVNNNADIKAGTMAVDVVLNNTATTIVKACPEAAGNTVDSGYPENDKITVTLKDFAEGSYLDELWGFGSIAFDNSKILVNAEISAKNVTVDQGSVVVFANHAAIGSAPGTGKLTLQNGGSLEVRNQIAVNGDMCGGDSDASAGTLIDNWANENDETEMITVKGQATGYTYFSTDYSSAKIKVMGSTLGEEYMAPKLSPELPPMTITCIPAAEDSPVNERIWTVENPVSKKYIFVNGTIDSSASDYTSHNGSTPELALATLEEAYDTVLNNGYIVLCGDLSLSAWPLNGTKSVTLTSKVTIGTGESARTYDYFSAQPCSLIMKDHLELKGVTTFEYLNIKADKNYVLGACGHKLVMGRQGDPDSLKMTNFPISVGGGGYNHAYSNINSDLIIHAGIYNIVSGGNSSDIINVYNKYSSVNITIDGGTFQSVYAKYNLYDDFSTANEISLSICNATVEKTISAIGTNYTMGNAYQVNIGENMKFGEACYIRTSATTINYTPNPAPNITFKIDGGTGTRYRIPTIYGGPGVYNGNNTMNETVTVDLKNVEVGTFICGSSNQTLQKKSNGSMELVLNENVHVSKLYLGGSMLAGASAKVFVQSDQAIIDELHSGSEFSRSTPETCELTYFKVGKDLAQPYVLNEGVCLDGLTKLILENAVVDLSQAGNSITAGEIDASKSGSIIYRGRSLTLNADYTAGTRDNPTMWYGQNAPRIVINGTVSGTTRLQSLSADPSAEGGSVTGKFYNGISVTASHSDTHSENNFLGLQSSEGGEPAWQPLTFTSEGETDTWKKTDEGDTAKRIQVYVSSEGSDSNSGAFPTPVKTLAQAYKNADALYKADASKTEIEIILLDDIVHNGELPASADLSRGFSVLVKSYDAEPASTLTIDSDLELPVDTTLDNIIIKSTVTTGSRAIFANGHTLTCTENLKVKALDGHYPVIYGGTKDAAVLDQTNLEIFGGTWSRIFGGSKTASVTTANLLVGGSVDTKNVGSIAENDTGVFGGGENGTVGTVNLSIDGGSFYRVLGGGLNEDAVVQENITVHFHQGTIDRLYGGGQRALTKGNITVNIGGSNAEAVITSIFRGSGLYAGVAEGKKATTNVKDGAIIQEDAQFAAGGYSGNLDETELNISGGSINCNVFAGGWGEGTDGTYGIVGKKAAVHITGGTIEGNVYGGGNLALVHNSDNSASALVTVTDGTVTGNVYGGGYSAGVDNTKVTIQSNVKGSVFGGGYDITADALQVQKSSTVTLEKRGTVEESVFGGSDTAGLVSESVSVTIAGDVTVKNGVFGGGSKAALQIEPQVKVNNGSTLTGSIYGGGKGAVNGVVGAIQNRVMSLLSLLSAEKSYTIDGLTDANVPSTKVIIEGTVTGDVFGGGEMATVGKEDSTTWNKTVTNVTLENGASVDGNIYGGGKGQSGKDYAVVYGCTSVSLNGGTVKADKDDEKAVAGAVFGGGQIAPVAGSTNVIVNGGTISNIFGGNDVEGEVNQTTNVRVPENSTAEVAHIYGGGRDAAHNRDSESGKENKIIIHGGTVGQIYGGGYGATAVSGNTDVTIAGGTVTGDVFGGGNAAKTKNASVTITGGRIETAYAGGNAATVEGTAMLAVHTIDGVQHVNTVFAGNNQEPMDIQPALVLTDGKIGTVYCGGNAGIMRKADGLTYDFDYPNIEVGTVYAGCNNTPGDTPTADVKLNLISGTYHTVYGGNNEDGRMKQTDVVIDQGEAKTLKVDTVYGGGNQADARNARVELKNGIVGTVYGGGNAATVTDKVEIQMGAAPDGTGNIPGNVSVTDLYCGNNEADMEIQPEIDLKKGTIKNFYAGGNAGNMLYLSTADGNGYTANYTFASDQVEITNLFGGCNQANMAGAVRLVLEGTKAENVYGGCHTSGTVPKAEILVNGNNTTNIYGGGYGEQTVVKNTDVRVQKGTVNGNVYGGSGFGQVENAKVQISDTSGDTHGRIQICGSVYGGGYGVSSVTGTTDVSVNMKLDIALKDSAEAATADLLVEEGVISKIDDGTSSGETQTSVTWKQTAVSCIDGNVYGGGDMGKVGDGMINQSSNTASITQTGSTHVKVSGGYIKGSVFGGGSGTPKAGQNYTVYMGTVFGNCETRIQGGYIEGSIYGCGYQSRVYAAEEGEKAGQAATVDIQEDEKASEIIIGTSVFGGGNKGEGSVQNASVYTVIGDTTVNISGYHQNEASVPIYFLSTGKGGVYGDGNLCLVQGNRTVNLTDFNAGTEHRDSLKTFYSLQRADTVNLVRSRIVLEGAQDLVDENADDTLYAINRVSQLNMEESSALKLTTIVNLLGGLSSDQNPDTVYIDKGNNGVNNYVRRGGSEPAKMLTAEQIAAYRAEYEQYKNSSNQDTSTGTYQSFNVVCVANGRYLEIKKSDSEYGNVTGLFTLELLHANPGEGGGFVYANIGAKDDTENRGSTGDFICVTKDSDAPDASSYMDVYDNVGGLKSSDGQTDYTWYYWYIKGGKYTYNAYIDGYIGTTETSFSESITLPEMNDNYYYILNSITGEAPVSESNSSSEFCAERLQDHWDEENDKDSDKYAIELQVVASKMDGSAETVTSIGYLDYKKDYTWTEPPDNKQHTESRWGIQYHNNLPGGEGGVYEKNNGSFVIGTGNEENRNQDWRKMNRFYKVESGTTGLELRFVLHKGTGVDVEIRDVPVTLTFDVLSGAADAGSGTGGTITEADSQLVVNSYTSITRVVPTQAVYLSSGRFYAGVSSDAPAMITKHSAFTAQFITRYVPSAFNTSGHAIQEKLTASFSEKYLLDTQTGIGFTIKEEPDGSCTLKYATAGNWSADAITKIGETYQVTKTGAEGAEGYTHNLQCESTETSSFTFPKGTVITMVAQMDEYDTTYWYYYCTEDTSEIALSKFTQMNTDASGGKKYSFSAASGGKLTDQSSNRVTEKLSFVFDFSNVPEGASAWWPGCTEAVKTIEGHLQLKHETTIGSYANVDIMDYVSEKTGTSAGEDAVTYVRAHPAVSNRYEISKEATGIEEFTVHLSDEKDTYYTRDTYGIQVEIAEDPHYINTQFDEREYAVMLELVDNTGSANPITKTKPFPEGTVFLYNGQKQVAGQDNQSVVIPVKTPGTHQIQIETGLEAFDTGDITIKASLYSSSVANYYNELKADQYTATVAFVTTENPEYALSVNANAGDANAEMKAHEIEKGAELSLKIKGRKGGQIDPNGIASVKVYQYENGEYALKAWSDLFAETEESISLAEDEVIWNPKISKTADAGTYRLEFTYQNKTEYWDLIVR